MRRIWCIKNFIWALVIVFLGTTGLYAQTSASIYTIALDWTYDGSKIASVGVDVRGEGGYIRIIDVNTSEIIFEHYQSSGGGFTAVAWSPNEQFLAVGGMDQAVHIFNVAAQEKIVTLQGHRWIVDTVDWNTSGTQLVSASSGSEQVLLWDTNGYQLINSLSIGDPWGVDFANDDRIAVGGFGVFIFPAYLDIGDNRNRVYGYAEAYVGSLQWNADNSRIAIGTQSPMSTASMIQILDVSTREIILNIQTTEVGFYSIDWSRDGSLIATRALSGTVSVWDAISGELQESFQSIPDIIADLAFSPYGGRLAYGTAFSPDALARTNLDALDPVARLAAHGIAVVVPAPSLERLNTIARLCGALAADAPAITAETLDGYIAALDDPARTAGVPRGCLADLQAVRAALEA